VGGGKIARMSRRLALGLAPALYLGLASCATNPVTGGQDFVLVTEAQELRIGRQADAQVKQRYPLYDAHRMQAYVEGIGERLAKASHRPGISYRFVIVDSADVNAFALPGGYVYISRGILPYLNSEAELAGVIGHEIGHVTARHSVQRLSAAQGAQIVVSVAQIFVPAIRAAPAGLAVDALGSALLSGYGRDQELQADQLGATYLARTGYDPAAMRRALEVLKNQETFDAEIAKQENREPRRYHGLFASHPENDRRVQEIAQHVTLLRTENATDGRDEYLKRSEGLVFGDNTHEGVVRDGVFYHRDLGIAMRLPPGWRPVNRPDRFVAIAPQGAGRLELRTPVRATGTPAEFVRRTESTGDAAPLEINGLAGAMTRSRDRVVAAIFHADRAYTIVGTMTQFASVEADADPLVTSIKSFRPITEAERDRAKALTIKLITADAGTRMADLAVGSPLGRNAEGYLRLMNGLYPKGEPVAGQTLKIVQ
jgi:predicted Zn-dependent protease